MQSAVQNNYDESANLGTYHEDTPGMCLIRLETNRFKERALKHAFRFRSGSRRTVLNVGSGRGGDLPALQRIVADYHNKSSIGIVVGLDFSQKANETLQNRHEKWTQRLNRLNRADWFPLHVVQADFNDPTLTERVYRQLRRVREHSLLRQGLCYRFNLILVHLCIHYVKNMQDFWLRLRNFAKPKTLVSVIYLDGTRVREFFQKQTGLLEPDGKTKMGEIRFETLNHETYRISLGQSLNNVEENLVYHHQVNRFASKAGFQLLHTELCDSSSFSSKYDFDSACDSVRYLSTLRFSLYVLKH
jgi:SAM-dependent methyltransferase